jgi:TolB-like protein/DNA-binding winged helix-turn-helix (wHTH) protein/Tfp pilus assembly protein PilF
MGQTDNVAREPVLVCFGVYEIDLRSGELRKAGLRIKVQELPLKILTALLERPGEVITREDLRKRIWPDETSGDFDHAVNVAIGKLRVALGDSSDRPHVIETVPRRGYRFIAPVKPIEKTGGKRDVPESIAPPRSGSGSPVRRDWRFLALLVVALLVIFLAYRGISRRYSSRNNFHSLAVLPLRNLSGDPDQDYFADGMTDEIITSLAKIRSLRVTSHTSTIQFKNTQVPIREIGQRLQVEIVLEGAVVRSGDRVRITAQLIEARTDRHLWAEEYNRDLRDVLALQGEVARDVAQKISVTMTPQESTQLATPRPVNVEAFEDYLKGRYYWNKRTGEGMLKASEYFQHAIDKDPNYGLAYSGLADCNSGLAWHGFLSPAESLPKARAAALKAIAIDPESGEGHASLALALYHQGEWANAESEFRRALELSPAYANTHHWYGDYLSAMGHHQEALAQAKYAFELDPLSPIINMWLGLRYYFMRDYEKAIEQGRKIVDFDPSFASAHLLLGEAYLQKGMHQSAIAELQKAAQLSGGSPLYLSQVGVALAADGRTTEALGIIEQLQKIRKQSYVSSYGVAQIYAALGDKQQAIKWLQSAYDERAVWMSYIKVDPVLDSIRPEPDFQVLVRRMRL